MARDIRGKTRNLDTLIDFSTIFLDLKRSLWLIIVVSISVAVLSYIVRIETYIPSYHIEATYVVSSRGINNDLLTNMSKAKKMAARFSQVINSSLLKERVAKDTGIPSEKIHIKAGVVNETNLLVLEVSADTPELAYRILKSTMKKYPELSDLVVSDAVMTLLVLPVVPSFPINPINPARFMIKVLILAFFGLTLLCIGMSCLKDTIRNGHDVEIKLGAPFLGEIYHEKKNRRNRKKSRYGESILISRNTVSFRYSESLRKICKRIQNRMGKKQLKTLLVTSTFENEGKSTVAANLALAIGEQAKKVVLVDLDFRKPALFKIFDLDRNGEYFLLDALEGKRQFKEMISMMEKERIYIAPNNKSCEQSTELMTPERLKKLFSYLKDQYDYIIIDSSPMALTADAEVIAGVADAAILVVKEHLASAAQINDMLDILDNCHSEMMGCIINDVRGTYTGFGGRGYGRYYGYGVHSY